MSASGESYEKVLQRARRGVVAGFAATVMLWLLKLNSEILPQLETIRFLDRVAEATASFTALPDPPMAGWIWHLVIGTLLWGALFGIMLPILPGRHYWVKGVGFGVMTGMLVMLMVMPLAGAGYFGMELTWLDPVVSLVFHIIYGVTLGAVYKLLLRLGAKKST
jgi:hypothetical protein